MNGNGIAITREALAVWSRYIHEICGIFLDESKGYLLETRLAGLIRQAGVQSFSELYYRVKSDLSHGFRRMIIDAITTNETSFFRDTSPFELLQHKLIPDLIDRRGKTGVKPLPPPDLECRLLDGAGAVQRGHRHSRAFG